MIGLRDVDILVKFGGRILKETSMSINKVILIGNVGQNPKVTYYDGGNCVAQLPLATTERGYTLQNGTQVPERTDLVNQKLDEKGLDCRVDHRSYDDQAGVKRYVTEIFVENMEMLSPKNTQPTGVPPSPQTISAQPSSAPAKDVSDDLPF